MPCCFFRAFEISPTLTFIMFASCSRLAAAGSVFVSSSAAFVSMILARNSYRPRDEAPNGTSGGRIAKVDRVEWLAIPDAATASAALLTGEVDWLDFPIPDMVPRLRQDRHVTVGVYDRFGICPVLRPNHISGPTANLAIRRAIMAALDGKEIASAAVGDELGNATGPIGVYLPGSTFETKAGMLHLGPRPPSEVERVGDLEMQRPGHVECFEGVSFWAVGQRLVPTPSRHSEWDGPGGYGLVTVGIVLPPGSQAGR